MTDPALLGYLDHVSPTQATGWAARDGRPADVVIAGMSTRLERLYRPDLVGSGIDPMSGFRLIFSSPIPFGDVSVRHLDGTPLTGSPYRLEPADPPNLHEAPRAGPIIFLHIPKTAGTSLRRAIDQAVPARVPLSAADLRDPGFLSRFAASPPPLAIGHVSYGVHHMLGIAPRYVTVLRNPVARVISLIRYARALGHREHAGWCYRPMREIVERGYTAETNNHACRMIAGVSVDQGRILTDQWLLDLAWHNLRRHFDLVGTVPALRHFQSDLGRLLGADLGETCHENKGDGVRADDEAREAMSAIWMMNALDLELYARVVDARAREADHG